MKELIDGKKYWLGAVYGIYKKDEDVFSLGNCFVPRAKTIYKDSKQ